jgi:hypothetical protein
MAKTAVGSGASPDAAAQKLIAFLLQPPKGHGLVSQILEKPESGKGRWQGEWICFLSQRTGSVGTGCLGLQGSIDTAQVVFLRGRTRFTTHLKRAGFLEAVEQLNRRLLNEGRDHVLLSVEAETGRVEIVGAIVVHRGRGGEP